MKFFVLPFTFLVICSADRLDRTYLPPVGADTAGGSDGALSAPAGPSRAGQRGLPSARPHAQSFRPQSQSPRPHSSVTGPDTQSNTFDGIPSSNSNFGQQNLNYQKDNNLPNARYPSSDKSRFSQESAFRSRPNTAHNINVENFDNAKPNYPSGNRNINVDHYTKNQRPQASQDANAAIIRSDSNIDYDGFSYSYETENGISADESGTATNGVQAQGSYSYVGDDGQLYSITYTADENGFRPVGDHLPTPPPIPDAILRSIEENARAAAANPNINYDEYDRNNGDQNRNNFPIGSQGRQSTNIASGVPNQQTPAKYHQNVPNTQGYNQYSAPAESRPDGSSNFPGARPRTQSSQLARQGSSNGSHKGVPGFTGSVTPFGTSNEEITPTGGRPSSQGLGGPGRENFGLSRPSASFSASSGYKY